MSLADTHFRTTEGLDDSVDRQDHEKRRCAIDYLYVLLVAWIAWRSRVDFKGSE